MRAARVAERAGRRAHVGEVDEHLHVHDVVGVAVPELRLDRRAGRRMRVPDVERAHRRAQAKVAVRDRERARVGRDPREGMVERVRLVAELRQEGRLAPRLRLRVLAADALVAAAHLRGGFVEERGLAEDGGEVGDHDAVPAQLLDDAAELVRRLCRTRAIAVAQPPARLRDPIVEARLDRGGDAHGRHPSGLPSPGTLTCRGRQDCDRHGLERPDRLRVRDLPRRARLARARRRQQHAPRLLRASTATRPGTSSGCGATTSRFEHHDLDVRDRDGDRAARRARRGRRSIVHAPAQPSHDLAAARPFDDFDVNAVGTLNLLEAARGATPRRRRSSSCPRTRSTATRRTSCRSSSSRRAGTTPTRRSARASTRRCGSTPRCTASSARRRSRPTCSCRSTAATSGCRRSASAAAA